MQTSRLTAGSSTPPCLALSAPTGLGRSVFLFTLSLPTCTQTMKGGSTPPSFPAPTPPSCCLFSSLWCFSGRGLDQSCSPSLSPPRMELVPGSSKCSEGERTQVKVKGHFNCDSASPTEESLCFTGTVLQRDPLGVTGHFVGKLMLECE